MTEERLERLNEIENSIKYMNNRIDHYHQYYREAINYNFGAAYIAKRLRNYQDALNGVKRLQKLFNDELDNIRYQVSVFKPPETKPFSNCCGVEMNGHDVDYQRCPSCKENCSIEEIGENE